MTPLLFSACATIADIQEAITTQQFERNARSQCQNMLCRITLTGATPLHSALTSHVLADLRSVINDRYPFFFIDDVVNETRAKIDKDAIEKEGAVPGGLSFDHARAEERQSRRSVLS